MAIKIMAEIKRKNLPSNPIENPIRLTNIPITTKDKTNPAARSIGPYLPLDAAVPRTTGTSGKTQGDKIDRLPAAKAKTRLRDMNRV
jgi:hypothetical protein